MTISSSTRVSGPYTGNGVTTAFPFSFKVFSTADLLVVQTDDYGVQSNLVLGTDYTVSLNANQDSNPGGTVNKVTALTSGYLLTLTSQVAETQATDLTNQGGFYPSVINAALDKLTILIQQLKTSVSRSLQFPITDSNISPTLPSATDRALKYLSFDSSGNPIANGDIPDTIYYGPNATDPTTRKNGTALHTGDIYYNTAVNQLRVYNATAGLWYQVSTTNDVMITRTGTATAGQSVFTFTGGYRVGTLNVYINGVLLQPYDYSATDGTTISFSPALVLGDDILVQSVRGLASVAVSDITGLQQAISVSSINAVAALNIDCSLGNYFTKTINADSTFTFSNAPSSVYYSMTIKVINTSGAITWPASVRWVNNITPVLTTGRTHLFMFSTDDAGTTWRGAAMVNFTA